VQREATLSVQIIRQIAPQETAAVIDVGGGTRAQHSFSREYGRFFGSPPTKDIIRLREERLASGDSA
jgi:hypothetical protein